MKTIAIVGASGVVGKELLRSLDYVNFRIEPENLVLFTSPRSAGKEVDTPYGKKVFQAFDLEIVRGFDLIFLSVSGSFTEEYGTALTEEGAIVIDKSSAFRYKEDVPLVIPEINFEHVKDSKYIATPNCTTSILAMPLYPIYKKYGLKKVIVSTYQATSGGGQAAMEELESETRNYLSGDKVLNNKFAHPIPFNLIPAIDSFQDNGYTKEEMKMVWETRKIFGIPDLAISCTSVRIPTFRSHAESVTVETEHPVDVDEVRELLESTPEVKVVDDPDMQHYPMPLTASEAFDVEVGRIRKNDVFGDFGLDFFVCGDQLLRGAAYNAVRIAERVWDER